MIMVRRNELACRDTWAGHLWAPKDGDADLALPDFQRPANLGPVAPANTADLRAIINQDTTAAAANQGEDVFLSEARIVSETHRPPAPQPAAAQHPQATPRAQPAASIDSRSAVFRAREAFRDKVRARDAAARLSAGAEASGGQPPVDAEVDPPAQLGAAAAGVQGAPQREQAARPLPPPAVEKHPPVENSTFTPAAPIVSRDATSPGIGQWLPVATEDEDANPWSLERWLAEPETASEPEPEHPELALERLVEAPGTPLPAWFRTDLPRMCRTCRDFRPATDGQRGWCANQWAFTHRTLVREEDVTPCDSAFGDWWAAVDDVWLVAADVSSHSRPTPLLDRILPLTPPARKRS